jgi:hypothetical protein
MVQKIPTRWNVNMHYDMDPNCMFVATNLRDAINEVYGRHRYKVVSSRPLGRLDKERARRL